MPDRLRQTFSTPLGKALSRFLAGFTVGDRGGGPGPAKPFRCGLAHLSSQHRPETNPIPPLHSSVTVRSRKGCSILRFIFSL